MDLLLVDDSALIRAQLGRLLAGIAGLRVVGMAANEADALALIRAVRPHVVLLDLALDAGHGFSVLKALRAEAIDCRVLVLTNQHQEAYRRLSLRLGADGFFDKSLDIDRLVAWLRARVAAQRHDSQPQPQP